MILLGVALPAPLLQAAIAQPDQPDPYQGRVIRSIILRTPAGTNDDGSKAYASIQDPLRQTVLNNIRSYPGSAYRRETIDTDVRRLNRLSQFAEIETAVSLNADASVDLFFTLTLRPLIEDIQSTGNRRVSDQDIAGEVGDLIPGTPVDRFQIDRAARRIEDLYRSKGYYFARVTIDERELNESGIILFKIREGERVKITAIRFDGSSSFDDSILRREIVTKTAGLFNKGQLDDDALDSDVASIIVFYRNHGYLDIRADRILQPSPNGREAIITFIIDEGPLYTLRSVRAEVLDGEPVFTAAQIAGNMPMKPGDVYGDKALQESLDAIAAAYGQLGYADIFITPTERRDTELPVVDLVLKVTQGNPYKVGEVIIIGNELTRQKVIRRQVETKPERPLDQNAIKRTKDNINRRGLVDRRRTKITIQRPDPYEPTYRDVLIEIAETNTGSFQFGGAISSDAGLIGRIALEQRNFDITDTPDSMSEFFSGRAFRGGGQTFRLELLPGNRVQTYSVSLAEPNLFETDYSASGNLFFRNRDFDEFDERRFGINSGVGRRFGTRWNGSIGFRIENIELADIPADAPTAIFDASAASTLIGTTLTLRRSSLNNFFLPTRGSRAQLSVEQVVGDYTFTKLEADYSAYIPLREDFLGRATVVSVSANIGYIPQGDSEVPVYERFYLGGQTFRGFSFRSVSPKGIRADNGLPSPDPVGATWSFFMGAEIRQPIFEDILAIVGFIDTGTVTSEPGFDDYRVSVGFGLRFSVPQLSPAPLAFDFGFPILKQDDDETRSFTFSIDLPF